MKIISVKPNNRRNEFSVVTRSGVTYSFPYAKVEPRPRADDRIEKVFVDKELANEGFSYVLESGEEGSVHVEQVLEYNEEPNYLAELLTYQLTLEAQRGIEESGLSRRQIATRLQTSVPQLYRLLDPTNTTKSMSQLIALLSVLNREVKLVVKRKDAA
jgi:predicted XRE-type DNA-binding protein